MNSWWDQLGTNVGNSLIGMQQPFGMAPVTDPAQRQQMIQQGLLTLAGSFARNKKNPFKGLSEGAMTLSQQAAENASRGAYIKQFEDAQSERKAQREQANLTKEWAKKQAWAKDYPIDTMDPADIFRLAASANKPADVPNSVQEYQYAQAHPDYQAFLDRGKEGQKPRTEKTSLAGRDVLMNLDSGEVIKDYGPTQSKGQTVPQAVQGDAIRTEQSFKNITQGLDRYEKLAKDAGVWGASVPGQTKDALEQERRNIQLQLKELFNLGVLNGPDLSLMEQMIFDPGISMLEPLQSSSKILGGTTSRVESSVSKLKEMLKSVRDNKLAVVKAYGGGADGATSPAEAPAEVDPAIWNEMTPEEKSLWQTSQ